MLQSIASALGIATESSAIDRWLGKSAQKRSVLTRDEAVGRGLERLGYEVFYEAPAAGHKVDVLVVTATAVDPALCQRLREEMHLVRGGGHIIVSCTALFSRRASARSRWSALLLHAGIHDVRQDASSGILLTAGTTQ